LKPGCVPVGDPEDAVPAAFFDEREQEFVLEKLGRVARYLQNFCAEAEGWYRCPAFHFKFDDRLEYQNKMDDLFDKIEEELRKNG